MLNRQKIYWQAKQAEEQIAALLYCLGYNILRQRLRLMGGEVDIIVERNHQIVLVEVKSTAAENSGIMLAKRQLVRIMRTGCQFCKQHNLPPPAEILLAEVEFGEQSTHYNLTEWSGM